MPEPSSLGCDVLELEGSLPWISCLPVELVPCVGGIFLPNRGYGPSHGAVGAGLSHIWGRASQHCCLLRLCVCPLELCCLFQVFTDGLTPWSISHHCSAMCFIRASKRFHGKIIVAEFLKVDFLFLVSLSLLRETQAIKIYSPAGHRRRNPGC